MGKTYVTQRGQTKRRATKRGGKGKKNKAVRGMSAALPVAPSPATIVFSAKLALGTHAPRFLFFLLTSVFLGCASPPIASSALPPPSSQIYTTGGKYQSKSFVQWDGPPPRQGRRGRLLWLSDRAGRATTKTAKGAVCALWSGVRSQCTCGLRDPEACAVATGRIQSGGPARGRGGTGAEPGLGRGGLGRRGAERAPGEMRALAETNTTHTRRKHNDSNNEDDNSGCGIHRPRGEGGSGSSSSSSSSSSDAHATRRTYACVRRVVSVPHARWGCGARGWRTADGGWRAAGGAVEAVGRVAVHATRAHVCACDCVCACMCVCMRVCVRVWREVTGADGCARKADERMRLPAPPARLAHFPSAAMSQVSTLGYACHGSRQGMQ